MLGRTRNALAAVALVTIGCDGGGCDDTEYPWYLECVEDDGKGSLDIQPRQWTLGPGEELRLHPDVDVPDSYLNAAGLNWYVDGFWRGTDELGHVYRDGPLYGTATYTAPPAIDADLELVWVTGKMTGPWGELCRSTPVFLVPESTGPLRITWWEMDPRVITPDRTEPVIIRALVEGGATDVELAWLGANGQPDGEATRLHPDWNGEFQGEVDPQRMLQHYLDGELTHRTGALVASQSTESVSRPITALVRTPDIPPVDHDTYLDAQITPYVFAAQVDERWQSTFPPDGLLPAFYDHFDDRFDFVVIVPQARVSQNPGSILFRNTIEGIGLPTCDSDAECAADLGLPPDVDWGSPARLQQFIRLYDAQLDGASPTFTHEVGHRWLASIGLDAETAPDEPIFPSLWTCSGGHWPLGDLASGVAGFSIGAWSGAETCAGGQQGGEFPFELVPTSTPGSYTLDWQTEPGTNFNEAPVFNDLELYLMGLVPSDEVGDHFVFRDQTQPMLPGETWSGAIPFGIDDVVRSVDTRNPEFGDAPTSRHGAAIVMTRHPLNDDELAYFDYMVQRAEDVVPIDSRKAGTEYKTTFKPFYVATGERGTLHMRLDDDPGAL